MAQFIYALPDDDLAPSATVTPSAVDSSYPGANLVDGDPGVPAKLSATSGNFVLDHGSAVDIQLVALIQPNLDPGLANVAVQRNATNVWTSPAMNVPITIPARKGDGYPVSPWKDLRSQTGYNGPTGYRYTRLNFGAANSRNISIGELVLIGTYRQLPFGVRWGSKPFSKRKTVKYLTDGGSIGYDLGVRIRRRQVAFDIKDTPGATTNLTAVETWLENAYGDLRPFLIVPDDTVNDAWFVTLADPEFGYTREGMQKQFIEGLEFIEAGRGVPA